MAKKCWQMELRVTKTPCFLVKGGHPCSNEDCLVDKSLRGMAIPNSRVGIRTITLVNLLLHTDCRISAFSPDNTEFKRRRSIGLFKPNRR